jgi:dihydropyrimidinase
LTQRLLLTGGTVVAPGGTSVGDVLVDNGKIVAVGHVPAAAQSAETEVVDVRGRLVIPGGVDVHTHLDTPFMGAVTSDDHGSGSRAAAAGGTTTFIDYAFQRRGERLPDVLTRWADRAAGASVTDYSFHCAVTDPYDGFVDHLRQAVGDGVSSFKVFMAYQGEAMLDDGQLFVMLEQAANLGATLCVHAENGRVIDVLAERLAKRPRIGPLGHALSRPPAVEEEAVQRAISIAGMAGSPLYLVHLSTAGAIARLAEAQSSGQAVHGETCAHYLLLDEGVYRQPGFESAKYVVSPPLRGADDRENLWRGLRDGILDVVSSDHCPFCLGQKELGRDDFRRIPNGAPGIEHRVQLLYGHGVRAGRLTLERFVEVVATGPGKRFGLYPRKGVISPGSDADLVVIDPEGTSVILASTMTQRCDNTPFEGWSVPGRIDRVYLRGKLIARGGRYVGGAPTGQFLARGTR